MFFFLYGVLDRVAISLVYGMGLKVNEKAMIRN